MVKVDLSTIQILLQTNKASWQGNNKSNDSSTLVFSEQKGNYGMDVRMQQCSLDVKKLSAMFQKDIKLFKWSLCWVTLREEACF